MAGMLNQLMDILEAELENYRKLLELSAEKTDVIIKDDIDRLKYITDRENSIIGNNQSLEKKREAVMDDMAIVLNRDRGSITIISLIEMLDGQQNEKSQLKQINDELKDSLVKLKQLNDHNGVLIRQAIEFIDFNINAVQSIQSLPPVSYQHGGKQVNPEGRNFFDAKQ